MLTVVAVSGLTPVTVISPEARSRVAAPVGATVGFAQTNGEGASKLAR